MLLLQTAIMGVFCARDLLLFYIFFDLTLVPLFLLIGIWGGADRRYAAYKFFIYTMTGSVLLLGGILYLAWRSWQIQGVFSFDFDRLYAIASQLSWKEQQWLLIAFFAAFAIKVPLFPLHTWLPLAHTEAPTAGSVILAGLLLKLGTYGFLRFAVPLFAQATYAYAPYLAGLAIIGILYTAVVAWVQTDFKKLDRLQQREPPGLLHDGFVQPEGGGAQRVTAVHGQPRPVDGGLVPCDRDDLRALSHPQHERHRRAGGEDAAAGILHGVLRAGERGAAGAERVCE